MGNSSLVLRNCSPLTSTEMSGPGEMIQVQVEYLMYTLVGLYVAFWKRFKDGTVSCLRYSQ